jgi:hypothetical protein
LADQVEAVFAAATAAFEDSGAYQEVGARTGASWLRHQLRMSPGEARRRIRVGQQLKDLPLTQAAFLAGDIGLAQVEILAAAVDDLGLKVVQGAEAELVELARLNDPWDLREQIRLLKHSVDPDSVDEAGKKALDKRHFTVTPVGDEWLAKGVLDAESGALVAKVLDTLSQPEPGDERSAGQRRADALADLCRSVLDAGLPQDNCVRHHLHLAGAPAGLRRTDRQSRHRAGRHPARARPHRPHRLRSPTARGPRVRDHGYCRVPGCRSRLVQLHHVIHWADGGHTDLDKLVSLCPRHHRNVHSGRLRIQAEGGQFRFFARDGRELEDHRRASHRVVTDLRERLLDLA